MIYVVDASTLINLANGEVLGEVLSLPADSFMVSTVVRRESKTIAKAIDSAVAAGRLSLIDDTLITIEDFTLAKSRMKLGEGETECIEAARTLGCSVACDDRAARRKAEVELGPGRVIGSIRLLEMLRDGGLLSPGSLEAAYKLMRSRGGFLPPLPDGYFNLP